MTQVEVPEDWYTRGFPPETTKMPWAGKSLGPVARGVTMSKRRAAERVLDLACGIGRHAMELRRRGFEVVGIDISAELLEIAERDAAEQGLEVAFVEAALRLPDYEHRVDIVLSLNHSPGRYFEADEG